MRLSPDLSLNFSYCILRLICRLTRSLFFFENVRPTFSHENGRGPQLSKRCNQDYVYCTGAVFIRNNFATDQIRLYCSKVKLFRLPFPFTPFQMNYEHAYNRQRIACRELAFEFSLMRIRDVFVVVRSAHTISVRLRIHN